VISRSELRDRDWSNACHVMCKNNVAWFRQCSVMFLGNMASHDPCSQRTWCKLRHTMHLRQFFGLTALLGGSICILCYCVLCDVDDKKGKNSFHFVISWCGPWATLHNFWASFFNVALGTSQYVYIEMWWYRRMRRIPWTAHKSNTKIRKLFIRTKKQKVKTFWWCSGLVIKVLDHHVGNRWFELKFWCAFSPPSCDGYLQQRVRAAKRGVLWLDKLVCTDSYQPNGSLWHKVELLLFWQGNQSVWKSTLSKNTCLHDVKEDDGWTTSRFGLDWIMIKCQKFEVDGGKHPLLVSSPAHLLWWFSLVVASLVMSIELLYARTCSCRDGWPYLGSTPRVENCNKLPR